MRFSREVGLFSGLGGPLSYRRSLFFTYRRENGPALIAYRYQVSANQAIKPQLTLSLKTNRFLDDPP